MPNRHRLPSSLLQNQFAYYQAESSTFRKCTMARYKKTHLMTSEPHFYLLSLEFFARNRLRSGIVAGVTGLRLKL